MPPVEMPGASCCPKPGSSEHTSSRVVNPLGWRCDSEPRVTPMANDTTSRTSGIDSTDTAWSLSVHSNGVVILTLSEADRAMTLVLSGKELETFKSAVCGKEV